MKTIICHKGYRMRMWVGSLFIAGHIKLLDDTSVKTYKNEELHCGSFINCNKEISKFSIRFEINFLH